MKGNIFITKIFAGGEIHPRSFHDRNLERVRSSEKSVNGVCAHRKNPCRENVFIGEAFEKPLISNPLKSWTRDTARHVMTSSSFKNKFAHKLFHLWKENLSQDFPPVGTRLEMHVGVFLKATCHEALFPHNWVTSHFRCEIKC